MNHSLEQNLLKMEQRAEKFWNRPKQTLQRKLRWRARHVRHGFHVLPGEKVLELGAGSGYWTKHLTKTFKGELPIVAASCDADLAAQLKAQELPNVTSISMVDLLNTYPEQSFDYIIGNGKLLHNLYPETLNAVHRLLKPAGQFLFFESNRGKTIFNLRSWIPDLSKFSRSSSLANINRYQLLRAASHLGFTHLDATPYDMMPSFLPERLVKALQSKLYIFEHAPVIKELCGSLVFWGKKPGSEEERRPKVNLATRPELFDKISVVLPCYNEAMNIEPFVKALLSLYNDYIHEILIVNDNSTDSTEQVTLDLGKVEPRVKLVKRTPPNGVGRTLKAGYQAATGSYILSMDCDFILILSELRDLFDVVADGHDGAIGSRFSHDSVLMNYPFSKIIGNRAAHFLVRTFLTKVRDVSNNLKLYKTEILKNLDIEEPHFAANLETGLKPILAGYDIVEVPISWIDRSINMGVSSFKVFKVGPAYFKSLLRTIWKSKLKKTAFVSLPAFEIS